MQVHIRMNVGVGSIQFGNDEIDRNLGMEKYDDKRKQPTA